MAHAFVRPPAVFGRRCPGCRRWTMRLPGDSLVPVLIAGPRGCGERPGCGLAPADPGSGPVARS